MCECRLRLELPSVIVREAVEAERAAALELFGRDFGRSGIVAFGQLMDLDATPTIVAEMNGEIAGALAYRPLDEGLNIPRVIVSMTRWYPPGLKSKIRPTYSRVRRRLLTSPNP